MTPRKCPICEHFWSQHDFYGCSIYQCECRYTDPSHVFVGVNNTMHHSCGCSKCKAITDE